MYIKVQMNSRMGKWWWLYSQNSTSFIIRVLLEFQDLSGKTTGCWSEWPTEDPVRGSPICVLTRARHSKMKYLRNPQSIAKPLPVFSRIPSTYPSLRILLTVAASQTSPHSSQHHQPSVLSLFHVFCCPSSHLLPASSIFLSLLPSQTAAFPFVSNQLMEPFQPSSGLFSLLFCRVDKAQQI